MQSTLNVKGTSITIFSQNEEDYVSLTDIAKGFVDEDEQRNSDYFILNWLRLSNHTTGHFLTQRHKGTKRL